MSRPTAIVVTTIFEPAFLRGYLESIERFGRREETSVYVIGDRKTPASVWQACHVAKAEGYRVECPALEEQSAFLSRIGLPAEFIPWNTDNRRNIGFLMALTAGAEVLISIDDDNFVDPDVDYVGQHHIVGQAGDVNTVRSSDGWFNICDLLAGWPAGEVFARGFPYFAQRRDRTIDAVGRRTTPVAINAGLWLADPDVDAIYRLCRRPQGTGFREPGVVLDHDTWSPINTQNTALTRDAASCYYYVRMGFPLRGLTIDRFGDILSGYLTQKVVKHHRHAVRLGTPIVTHRRTQHNLFKDLYHELAGIVLIEELLPWLVDVPLSGTDYLTTYRSLADELARRAGHFQGFIWDDGGRDFLKATAANMKTWADCVQRLT